MQLEKATIMTPAILVVFGATGDLFKKKIVPAIRILTREGRLPERFRVIGFGRRALTDTEFRAGVIESVVKSGLELGDAEVFATRFSYLHGDFNDVSAFDRLKEELVATDEAWGMCSAKAFYLAVPSELLNNIFEKLDRARLTEGCDTIGVPARIMIEKPFGRNLVESQVLNASVSRFFKESEIYRMDHYLAKDSLRALPRVRASAPEFEKLLTKENIEHIHIRLLETVGAENRGPFYDRIVGAWRDVGENHLLQMLALLLMDLPKDESAEAFRKARADFIAALPRLSDADIVKGAVRAQHEGYRSIVGVAPESMTETYFKVSFTLAGKFAGVPVTAESGKRFRQARKGIEVTLKGNIGGAVRIDIEIQPSMRIVVRYKDGEEKVYFMNDEAHYIQYAVQYAELIVDALKGDQTWFVSEDEVEHEWRFADPVTEAFEKNLVPLKTYSPGVEEIL